jgi:hypothetical protein
MHKKDNWNTSNKEILNQMQQGMLQAIVRLVEAMALAFKRNTQNNVPPRPTSSVEHEK